MTIKAVNLSGSQLKTRVRKNKADKMSKEMLLIVNSNLHKYLILSMDRNYWLKGESKKSIFHKMTNSDIYEHLMWAKEDWTVARDRVINIILIAYWSVARTIGYMIPGKKEVHINTRYWDNYSTEDCGSNGYHEWRHHMGARHSGPFFRQSFAYHGNQVYKKCYDHLIRKKLPDIDLHLAFANAMVAQVYSNDFEIEQPEYELVVSRPLWKLGMKHEVAVRVS